MPNWRFPKFDWDDDNVEHIIERHNVYPDEVEQVFYGRIVVRRIANNYEVYGRDESGRYLFVICVERGTRIRIVTAREMDRSERKRYERNS